MKNAILTGCGLGGLALCRWGDLCAVMYIPFAVVLLVSALGLAKGILTGKEIE